MKNYKESKIKRVNGNHFYKKCKAFTTRKESDNESRKLIREYLY